MAKFSRPHAFCSSEILKTLENWLLIGRDLREEVFEAKFTVTEFDIL